MISQTFSEAAFNAVLVDLNIDDEATGRPLTVTVQTRELVRNGLERALIDPAAMQAYLDQLDAMGLARPLKHDELLPDERVDAILQGGLAGVPDDELAALALNPLAILDLRDAIEEDISDYWWSVATRFCPDAALIDRVVGSKLDQLDAVVHPRRENGRVDQNAALTIALGDQPEETAARTQASRPEHWNAEHPLSDAEFLASHDTGRAERAKATTVIVDFHLLPERESGTLEVLLSQPLPLSGPATCTAKLLDASGNVLQDAQGRELEPASITARDGCLRFSGIGPLVGQVHWLEIDYHHPDCFHLRLRIPFRRVRD